MKSIPRLRQKMIKSIPWMRQNPEKHTLSGRTSPLRSTYTRDFAPWACSRGTLREQSSSVCANDFMGILHPREQHFHPAKCSTIFNRLNIWEQASGASGADWANLKTLPRVYWHVQNENGACSGSKTPCVHRPLSPYKGVPPREICFIQTHIRFCYKDSHTCSFAKFSWILLHKPIRSIAQTIVKHLFAFQSV